MWPWHKESSRKCVKENANSIVYNFPCYRSTGMSQVKKSLGNTVSRFIKQIFTGYQLVSGSVLGVSFIPVNKMDKNLCLLGIDILVLFAVIQKDFRKFVNFFQKDSFKWLHTVPKKQNCCSICHLEHICNKRPPLR